MFQFQSGKEHNTRADVCIPKQMTLSKMMYEYDEGEGRDSLAQRFFPVLARIATLPL